MCTSVFVIKCMKLNSTTSIFVRLRCLPRANFYYYTYVIHYTSCVTQPFYFSDAILLGTCKKCKNLKIYAAIRVLCFITLCTLSNTHQIFVSNASTVQYSMWLKHQQKFCPIISSPRHDHQLVSFSENKQKINIYYIYQHDNNFQLI